MDTEVKASFEKVDESINKLATMVANGFSDVRERFVQVDQRFDKVDAEIAELRNEIRSIRTELGRIPDDIDATYAGTLNSLLERVSVIEKKLGITV
jgi:predicted  nucleic acid-binding Zn-ribbon protein